ncbi:MAG: formylglycine-generating enzyme family protein [Bacteroidales bacterium]|nr:formylglycine-generating enzyme family protein [Bacteroidales bacterium]MCF8389076.1 formylglycine-generating enzyme family protein [Bacteroidales bacterium]
MISFIRKSLVVFLFLTPAICFTQSISNIRAVQKGDFIIVNYDFNYYNQLESFEIELYVSTDGGRTFSGPLQKVSGDVGAKIYSGSNRQITWRVLEEFQDLFSNEIVFEIRGSQKLNFDIEFVFVTGGSINMGSKSGENDEKPIHKITVDDFYLSKYEITQAQWFQVMGTNPAENNSCPQCPVERVSYVDVLEFIGKINRSSGTTYRLPTEAEWEYAAGDNSLKNQNPYAGSNLINSVAWYNTNSNRKTQEVGKKLPNAYGCYDMSGNVQEWCMDFYSPTYYISSPTTNPQGPPSGSTRVIRGGAFNMSASHCTIFSRNYEVPEYSSSNLGFRLVKIVP